MSVLSSLKSVTFEMSFWLRCLLPGSSYLAVYYPTPDPIINRMFILSSLKKDDTLLDLGCGDGRVLIAASKLHGCRGIGYELDATLASEAISKVKGENLGHLIKIVQGDAMQADDSIPQATVIAMYLSERGNRTLVQRYQKILRPGTRLVSFFFPIEGWEGNLKAIDSQDNMSVYLYTAPHN